MKVTSVKITITDSGTLKAYASVCFNDQLIINGVRVFEREDRTSVVMPAKKSKTGNRYHDYAYAVDRELRDQMTEAVMEAYKNALENVEIDTVETEEE